MEIGITLWNLFLVFFLVFLNGFFVAAEFAMVKVRSSQIEAFIQQGHSKAKYAKQLIDHLDSYLSACQLGITLASLGLGWIGEPAIAQMLSPLFAKIGLSASLVPTVSFIIAFSIITALHIILGELAPKSIAIQKADRVALWTAGPLIIFNKLMYPIIYFMNGISIRLLKSIGIHVTESHESAHTQEEIRLLMKESQEKGLMDSANLAYFDNIFDFSETSAEEIMVPRTDMICLYLEDSFETNLNIVLTEGKTRYPLCDFDKDHILGYIHIRDLIKPLAEGRSVDVQTILRTIPRIPKSMPIKELLRFFQDQKSTLAVVLDEFGGTSGLVTLEDVLEEIVGEIQDEFDSESPLIERLKSDHYLVDGLTPLSDIEKLLQIDFENDDLQSIGGWMLSQVTIPPKENKKIIFNGFQFTILKAKEMRIQKVLIEKID